MKKSYVKPQVLFEDFHLSASIATGCNVISNAAEHVCPATIDFGFVIGTRVVYTDKTMGCEYTAVDPTKDDSVCYHPGVSAQVIFTSA